MDLQQQLELTQQCWEKILTVGDPAMIERIEKVPKDPGVLPKGNKDVVRLRIPNGQTGRTLEFASIYDGSEKLLLGNCMYTSPIVQGNTVYFIDGDMVAVRLYETTARNLAAQRPLAFWKQNWRQGLGSAPIKGWPQGGMDETRGLFLTPDTSSKLPVTAYPRNSRNRHAIVEICRDSATLALKTEA